MRTKLLGLLIIGFTAIVLIPAISSGQPGGGFGKKGQKGGGMDPNQQFEYYAKGKPYVVIADMRNSQFAVQFAKDKNITNGQLTLAQFLEYQEQLKAKMFGPGGGGPGGGKNGGGKKGGPPDGMTFPPGGGAPTQAPAPNLDFINGLADIEFRGYDTNGDGKLNMDEMPERLKSNLEKWDKNKDGLIDLAEYREFFLRGFLARMGGGGGPAGGGADQANRGVASIIIDLDELDKKTVVFRAGNLPSGLPDWFVKFDTNGDGQVALYEWRAGGKPLEEFKDWDLNDDGLITPEEALKVQATFGKTGTSGTVASSRPSMSDGGRPSFGPPDGKGWDPSKMKKKDKGKNNN